MSSNAIKCGVRADDVDFGWHCKTSGISREDSGGIGQLWGCIEWILATSTLPGGVEQLWGGIANFLAVIFLLAAASRAALFALVSSFLAVVAFAAGNALLLSSVCGIRYRRGPSTVGIRIRCSKRLPGVRDAFSEAFGVKNRLLRYGRDIRYRKPPSQVRNEATIAWLALIRRCG